MGELEVAAVDLPSGDGAVVVDDPDGDIAALVAADEHHAALTALMRRHGAAVYRYCREALRDPTLADDIHQQVFVQAHRDLRRFAGRATMRTWLFAIARHRVLDAAKARRRSQAHLEGDELPLMVDPVPAPDERLDDARLQRAIVQCFGLLGEPMRTALLLRYQHGFSFDEMAKICGERAGTLQARVSRALPRLRAYVDAAILTRSASQV